MLIETRKGRAPEMQAAIRSAAEGMLSADALERCYAKAFVANVAELAAATLRKWRAKPVVAPIDGRQAAKTLVSFTLEAAKACGISAPSAVWIAVVGTPAADIDIDLIAGTLEEWAEALEAWTEGDQDAA